MSSAIRNIIDTYDGIVDKLQAGFIPLLLVFAAYG